MIYEDIYICCRVKSVLEKKYIILIFRKLVYIFFNKVYSYIAIYKVSTILIFFLTYLVLNYYYIEKY